MFFGTLALLFTLENLSNVCGIFWKKNWLETVRSKETKARTTELYDIRANWSRVNQNKNIGFGIRPCISTHSAGVHNSRCAETSVTSWVAKQTNQIEQLFIDFFLFSRLTKGLVKVILKNILKALKFVFYPILCQKGNSLCGNLWCIESGPKKGNS